MKRHPIVINRASVAIEWRYNLFRHKWQPDLCCAVPEHHPVPGFITGERWAFAGAWEPAAPPPGLNPAAAEMGVCLNGFHLFQIAGPDKDLTLSEYPAAFGLRRAVARRGDCIAAR
jgi:hypothetical protein